MAAYHLEALRRQRVIDRKVEALSRMAMRQEEEERLLKEQIQREANEKLEQEEGRRREREEHLRQCGGKTRNRAGGYSNKQTQVKFHTQNDLRQQHKTLRDHGLVMGHVNEQFFA